MIYSTKIQETEVLIAKCLVLEDTAFKEYHLKGERLSAHLFYVMTLL